MSKKQPKPATKKARNAAPTGLAYAFRLIDEAHVADRIYPHAVTIIDHIDKDLMIEDELMRAARAVFPPAKHDSSSGPKQTPELAALGGFYVGFAACWLLMTQINGGVR